MMEHVKSSAVDYWQRTTCTFLFVPMAQACLRQVTCFVILVDADMVQALTLLLLATGGTILPSSVSIWLLLPRGRWRNIRMRPSRD